MEDKNIQCYYSLFGFIANCVNLIGFEKFGWFFSIFVYLDWFDLSNLILSTIVIRCVEFIV